MKHLTVPALPTSARTARRFISSFCHEQRLSGQVVDDAVLLVSELTGNAVLHARSEARIGVELADSVLRVEVRDDSPLLPQRRQADAHADGGRGMHIVEAVSSLWGATQRTAPPPGKVVWFELRTA